MTPELGLVAPSDGIELEWSGWVGGLEGVVKDPASMMCKLRTAHMAISPARLVRFDVLKTRSLMLW
jgi:hypothetical protein